MKNFISTLKFIINLIILNIFSSGISILFTCIFFKNPIKTTLISISLSYLIMFCLLYYFSTSYKYLISKDDFKKISIKNVYYIALFGFGFSVILSILTILLDSIFPSYTEISNKMLSQNTSIINLICSVVFIPICEEIIFRGMIFKFLKRYYSLIGAIFLQALFFGIAHGNIVQGIYTFIGGIALALIYVYCGSMIGNIILHMIYNLCGLVIMPEYLFTDESINYLFMIIGVIVFIFSSFKMISNYKKDSRIRLLNDK